MSSYYFLVFFANIAGAFFSSWTAAEIPETSPQGLVSLCLGESKPFRAVSKHSSAQPAPHTIVLPVIASLLTAFKFSIIWKQFQIPSVHFHKRNSPKNLKKIRVAILCVTYVFKETGVRQDPDSNGAA